MASKYLDGSMVPRAVKRHVDHRSEPRTDAGSVPVVVIFRGRRYHVALVNVSASGAMLNFSLIPYIGETIRLRLSGRGEFAARVCWVRNGRVGVTFAERLK